MYVSNAEMTILNASYDIILNLYENSDNGGTVEGISFDLLDLMRDLFNNLQTKGVKYKCE